MQEHMDYVGNPHQLFGVRRVCLQEGSGKGSTILEVHTAGGLQVDILPDSGLDIGQVRYLGRNMSFLSKNGYDGPARCLPYEQEFLHSFPGGMLYTCGLRNTGPGNRDDGQWQPMHGRYHSSGAENLCVAVRGDDIVISGALRETALFGHVLELERTITLSAYGSSIHVQDSISNLTNQDEEWMLLYHCNFGYPLLSEHSKLLLPQKHTTTPRTEYAKAGLGQECSFTKPLDGEGEMVFFHEKLEKPETRIENPDLGLAATLRWNADTLPILAQWKSMASGDYALGLEPTNSYIMGRSAERKNGILPVLRAHETVKTEIMLTFETI